MRGATETNKNEVTKGTISTHASLAGRDFEYGRTTECSARFQPTRPLRGATCRTPISSIRIRISTHASLAGRDQTGGELIRINPISTHASLAGRDSNMGIGYELESISTHASLAGRDSSSAPLAHIAFISTHASLAGRDDYLDGAVARLLYFNPRVPCGARQQECTNHYAHFCDNRQISDVFAQNADCQGILFLFCARKTCKF